MSTCDVCGKSESMPYQCHHCGGTHCSDHRLPEAHDCPGLENWGDPDGVFDSGFNASLGGDGGTATGRLTDRFSFDTGPGSMWGYFRGNMTYVFLALMWITFFAQHVVILFGGVGLHQSLFVLSSRNPLAVWTWFTSIFAHAPFTFWHIAMNSIVIFFFGRLVERYVGSRNFTILFIGAGVLAGFGQIALSYAPPLLGMGPGDPTAVLGASGAGLAIMGVLTIVNPDLKVYIWFLLPVPIWALTGFYLFASIFGVLGGDSGGVANMAHLVGLVIGLWYGHRVKGRIRVPGQLQFGGGPGGPGGPGRRRGPF